MYNNLLIKELKLGVAPIYYVLPFLTGALMLVPAWLYFVVLFYFFFITVPNMHAGYKTQNDLMFTTMLPVTKRDIIKARVSVIVILELLHVAIAVIFGMISLLLYPNLTYYFFKPTMGFWGLCFVTLAVFNICFLTMYYKTAYKYGVATVVSIAVAMVFAGSAEWLGIKNAFVVDLFKGSGADNLAIQLSILLGGIAIYIVTTYIAYQLAYKRFKKVEIG